MVAVPRKTAGVPDSACLATQTIQVSRDRGSHGAAGELAPEQLVHSDAAYRNANRSVGGFPVSWTIPLWPSLVPRLCGSFHKVGRGRAEITYAQGVGAGHPALAAGRSGPPGLRDAGGPARGSGHRLAAAAIDARRAA